MIKMNSNQQLTVPARPRGGSRRRECHGSAVVATVATTAIVVATFPADPPQQDGVSHPVAWNQDDVL